MPRINEKQVRALIRDRYSNILEFCHDFGCAKATLYKWFKAEDVKEHVIDRLAEHFDCPRSSIDLSSRSIDTKLLTDIVETVSKIANLQDVTLNYRQLIAISSNIYKRYDVNGIDEDLIRSHLDVVKEGAG